MTLGSVKDLISFVDCEHGLVHLDEFLSWNLILVAWRDDVALAVHDAEALEFVEFGLEFHFVRESVVEQVSVDLVHGTERAHSLLEECLVNSLAQHLTD